MTKNIGGLILGMSFYNSCVIDVLESLKNSIKPEFLRSLNDALEDARNVHDGLRLAAEEVILLEILPEKQKEDKLNDNE